MGSVPVQVHCPACRQTWAEIAFKPENWEGWRRTCPNDECGHHGLKIFAPPDPDAWKPEEDRP